MKVRLATTDDVDAVAGLNREVQKLHADAQPHLFKQPDDLEPIKADIRDRMLADAEGHVLIAEDDDGQPVGYAYARFFRRPETPYTYAHHFLHIDQISVKSGSRGRGCGRLLVDAVFALARAEGCEQVTLDTRHFNRNAQAFFARMGFEMLAHRMTAPVGQVEPS